MRLACVLALGTVCAALVSPAPVSAGETESFCSGGQLPEACYAEDHRERVDRFDLKPAEELARAGVEGVRVFMVNDYWFDLPMTSVLRTPGSEPVVEARALREPGLRVISSSASSEVWMTSDATAPTEPSKVSVEVVGPDGQTRLCIHSSLIIVERLHGGSVTRRVYAGCPGSESFDRAIKLQVVALKALPQCARLSWDHYQTHRDQLRECVKLSGPDAISKADIVNRIRGDLEIIGKAGPSPGAEEAFHAEVVLARNGRQLLSGREAVAEAWFRSAVETDSYLDLREVTTGADAGRVTGSVIRGTGGKYRRAPFTQDWIRGQDGLWRLRRWTIGSYKASR